MKQPDQEESLKESFEKELDTIRKQTLGGPGAKRRRFIIWGIRTLIAALLYFMLWEYQWVRWTLLLYIPLNLFGFLSAYGWNYFLNRKMQKTLKKIEEAEKALEEQQSQQKE